MMRGGSKARRVAGVHLKGCNAPRGCQVPYAGMTVHRDSNCTLPIGVDKNPVHPVPVSFQDVKTCARLQVPHPRSLVARHGDGSGA